MRAGLIGKLECKRSLSVQSLGQQFYSFPFHGFIRLPSLTDERRGRAKVSLHISARFALVRHVHRSVTRTVFSAKCSRDLSVVCKSSVRNLLAPVNSRRC